LRLLRRGQAPRHRRGSHSVYRNTALTHVALIPGYAAAKHAEDRKFYVDRTSTHPIATVHGGPHVLVPFVAEDGGRICAHALALMKALATVALEKGRRPPHVYRAITPSPPTLASVWAKQWQQRMSSWLHLAILKHVIRLMGPNTAARLRNV